MKISATIVIFSLALGGCSVVGIHDAYEQPPYTVVETISEDVEIRRYSSRLVAEVTVDVADPDKSNREAFGLLFAYISGDNAPNAKIEMTSPVAMTRDGARISMTTPVETAATGGDLTMRFFLPSSFAEATAPWPTNSRVSIVTVPEQTVAHRATIDEKILKICLRPGKCGLSHPAAQLTACPTFGDGYTGLHELGPAHLADASLLLDVRFCRQQIKHDSVVV